jgi:hypothetical protein
MTPNPSTCYKVLKCEIIQAIKIEENRFGFNRKYRQKFPRPDAGSMRLVFLIMAGLMKRARK